MSAQVPRWKVAIDGALKKDSKAIVYQLATVNADNQPRVRSLIHRGFISPGFPARPLLLTTTDIRTPKTREIAQNSRVELAWWVTGTQEQFRIAGTAHIWPAQDFGSSNLAAPVGTDKTQSVINEDAEDVIRSAATNLARAFPGERLGGEGFDWEAKRVEVFESMSGHMKASWARPVPGTPLPGGYASAKDWPEKLPSLSSVKEGRATEIEERLVKDALRNFALVVIEPLEVDYVELGVMPNQRTVFKLVQQGDNADGQWSEEIVVA